VSAVLHERARRARQRIALRAWQYRQRHHAHGTWHRLRRVLADAERAFVASEDQGRALLVEGFRSERVGAELEPPKTILFVPAHRIAELQPLREIALRLDADLLAARVLLLVRFPGGPDRSPPAGER
jgi:hypothetical protein